MENDLWYDYFIKYIYKKYPKKTQLTEALMNLLCIEREAVYRRLRKDVNFTASEIMKIASAWNISLDEIVGIRSNKVSFQMQPVNYFVPSKEDMDFIRKRIQLLKDLKGYSNSEYIVIFNNLSRSLSAGFMSLYKFNVFKWHYQYSKEKTNISYSQTVIQDNFLKEIAAYHQGMRNFGHTSYILDSKLFDNLINDIKVFHSILLITDEDKKLIKEDLNALLDYLLEVATAGCFPETGNKVQIYVSMLNINTNYSYANIGKMETCRIHPFNMYDMITYNQEMIKYFKEWMLLKKRTSIQISEVDERSRIEFFARQRQLVEDL